MLLSNDAKQIDHILCVCSFSLKWEMAASGRLGEVSVSPLWSTPNCASCAQPSSSGCCWHQFKPQFQFQPQDVAEITENQSVSQDLVEERRAVGWVDGRDTLVTPGQQHTETQTVFEVPQHMAGVCEASSLCGFPAEKKTTLWLCCCKMQPWCIL